MAVVVMAPGPPDVMGHRKQGQEELAGGLRWERRERNGGRSAVDSRKGKKSGGYGMSPRDVIC